MSLCHLLPSKSQHLSAEAPTLTPQWLAEYISSQEDIYCFLRNHHLGVSPTAENKHPNFDILVGFSLLYSIRQVGKIIGESKDKYFKGQRKC